MHARTLNHPATPTEYQQVAAFISAMKIGIAGYVFCAENRSATPTSAADYNLQTILSSTILSEQRKNEIAHLDEIFHTQRFASLEAITRSIREFGDQIRLKPIPFACGTRAPSDFKKWISCISAIGNICLNPPQIVKILSESTKDKNINVALSDDPSEPLLPIDLTTLESDAEDEIQHEIAQTSTQPTSQQPSQEWLSTFEHQKKQISALEKSLNAKQMIITTFNKLLEHTVEHHQTLNRLITEKEAQLTALLVADAAQKTRISELENSIQQLKSLVASSSKQIEETQLALTTIETTKNALECTVATQAIEIKQLKQIPDESTTAQEPLRPTQGPGLFNQARRSQGELTVLPIDSNNASPPMPSVPAPAQQ